MPTQDDNPVREEFAAPGRGLRKEASPSAGGEAAGPDVPDDTVLVPDRDAQGNPVKRAKSEGDMAHQPSLNTGQVTSHGELGPGLEPAQRVSSTVAGATATTQIRTEEMASKTANIEDESEGATRKVASNTRGLTEEIGIDLEMDAAGIENIPLRKTNPLEGPDEATAEQATSGVGETAQTRTVGVIDEIAELAASLDPELISAKSPIRQSSEGEDRPLTFAADVGIDDVAPRARKGRMVFVVGSFAALVAVGVFFWQDIEGLVRGVLQRENVASASGGGPGTGIESPVDGAPNDGMGGPDSASSGGQPGEIGRPVEQSSTREVVRDRVVLSLKLGLQWVEGKE
jgi:hypothetical protein